ncbi:MAG: TolC family protein, partial [Cyanobacteria bacterium J06631_6]
MGKKNQFIKILGISTAIAMSQIASATAESIAQADDVIDDARDAAEEIIKPAQPSISDTQQLNPSGNPLSFPTAPEEVQVEAQKPITLEQAVELSLNNNKEIEQARLEVERAEFALREERAALFPTLDFTTSFGFSDDAFLDSPLQQTFDNTVDDLTEQGLSEEAAQAQAEEGVSGASGSTSTDSL